MDHISQPVVNIIYWLPYFMGGGIIFFYKDKLIQIFNKNKKVFIVIFIALLTSVIRIINPSVFGKDLYDLYRIICDASLLIFAIVSSNIILCNRATKFISTISFEIYLSHTMMIRVASILKLLTLTQNNVINMIISSVFVLIATIIFSYCATKAINLITLFLEKKLLKKEIINN